MSWRRILYVVGAVELTAGMVLSAQVARTVADPLASLSAVLSQALAGLDIGQLMAPLPQSVLALLGF